MIRESGKEGKRGAKEGEMSEEKLKAVVARLNELRHRLEPVEQHWGWTAEELHRELRHVLHTLNGLVTSLRAVSEEAPEEQR
jgi:hypothetical protein